MSDASISLKSENIFGLSDQFKTESSSTSQESNFKVAFGNVGAPVGSATTKEKTNFSQSANYCGNNIQKDLGYKASMFGQAVNVGIFGIAGDTVNLPVIKPEIHSPAGLNKPLLQAYPFVEIRAKTDISAVSENLIFRFQTEADPTFSVSKEASVPLTTDNEFHTYAFDFSENVAWSGTLERTAVKITEDAQEGGTFLIDYIKIHNLAGDALIEWTFNFDEDGWVAFDITDFVGGVSNVSFNGDGFSTSENTTLTFFQDKRTWEDTGIRLGTENYPVYEDTTGAYRAWNDYTDTEDYYITTVADYLNTANGLFSASDDFFGVYTQIGTANTLTMARDFDTQIAPITTSLSCSWNAAQYPVVSVAGHNHEDSPHTGMENYVNISKLFPVSGFGVPSFGITAGDSAAISASLDAEIEHVDITGNAGQHIYGKNTQKVSCNLSMQFVGIPTDSTAVDIKTALISYFSGQGIVITHVGITGIDSNTENTNFESFAFSASFFV